MEHLENRALPSAYTANTAADLINDINAANAASGANTITLVAPTTSPYVLTAVNSYFYEANGLPVIAANDNLTIVGNGDTIERSTASSTPDFRLLAVTAGGSLTLQNLTLEGGDDASGNGGGAILNMGTLVLNDVTVQHNSALIAGGGIYSDNGSVTLEGGTIVQNNTAASFEGGVPGYVPGDGGGLYAVLGPDGALTVTNATLDNNNAVGGFGGGLYIYGGNGQVPAGVTVSLSNDTVASNTAGAEGGGLYLYGATVTLSNDTVKSNTATISKGGGGGLYVLSGNVTLDSDTVVFNSATYGSGGGLFVYNHSNVTLDNDTLNSNSATKGYGGGLYVNYASTVTFSNDTVESNSSSYGGGLYVQGSTVTLTYDTVKSNTATSYGGGIYIVSGNTIFLDSFTVINTINNTDHSGLNGSTANIDGTFTLDYVQTETSIRVSPAVASLDWGVTQQFTAIALDQFGQPMATQPALTWTVAAGGAGGSVSTGGLYTAPFMNGSDTVVATDAGINLSGAAAVTVTLTPPTVTVPAAANPSPVTGTTTNLSVAGYDPGDSSLTYTWAVTSAPAGAPTPTFSSNGSNAAHNTTVTFYLAGNYTFQATISDPDNQTAVSSVIVTVVQTVTSISITPANVTVADGSRQQFTAVALDQFGQAMASQPTFTWQVSSTSGGTISKTGLYTAPKKGTGTFEVAVSADGLSTDATVTVIA